MLSFFSLLLFTAASIGFIVFMLRYPRQSLERTWGMRLCYFLGFAGVLAIRLSKGYFSEATLLVISSLLVSLIASELSARYLK
ncbi:MAG: hypothetical protein HY645_02060 [Acidobacteria bacterium]|nr:hypothetical protein [Acidobacteriota bacterium]